VRYFSRFHLVDERQVQCRLCEQLQVRRRRRIASPPKRLEW
jgi:hypothetical protein